MPFTIGPKTHNVSSPELRNLIGKFFSIQNWKNLYLTGGTCLAEYYFGHRTSQDMDLFTPDRNLFEEARMVLKDPSCFAAGTIAEIRGTPHLAQFLFTPGGPQKHDLPIKIDLMLDIPVRLAPPLQVASVWIDSLEDLLANKLGCLIQREDVKDYLDIYYLIPAAKLSIKEIMETGRRKDAGLDPLIVAHQINFILDKGVPEKALLGKTDWSDLQRFFRDFQSECLELIRPR